MRWEMHELFGFEPISISPGFDDCRKNTVLNVYTHSCLNSKNELKYKT